MLAQKPVCSGISGDCAGLPETFSTACRQTTKPVLASGQMTSRFAASPPVKKNPRAESDWRIKALRRCGRRPQRRLGRKLNGNEPVAVQPLPSNPRKPGELPRNSSSGKSTAWFTAASPPPTNLDAATVSSAKAICCRNNPEQRQYCEGTTTFTNGKPGFAPGELLLSYEQFSLGFGRRRLMRRTCPSCDQNTPAPPPQQIQTGSLRRQQVEIALAQLQIHFTDLSLGRIIAWFRT